MIKRREMTMILILVAVLAGLVPAQSGGDALLAAKFKEATDAQRSGNLEQAAAAYSEVLKLQPSIAEAHVNLGLVRYQQKQFGSAVESFKKGLRLKPTLGGAQLFLGISYYSLNQHEEALKALEEAARLAPSDPHTLMWLGVTLLAESRSADAAKHLDAAALLAPKDIDILYHRGRAHLKLSQESYQQMFKADPKSGRVHQVLAQSYDEAGRNAEAIAEYELTARLAPNMPGIYEALGSLYWKTADMDKAEVAFQRELEIDPHSILALYKLGSIRVERGNPEQGLPLLEAAIQQNPTELDAYYYLGKAQGLMGQHEAGIANLRKLIEGDPENPLVESAYYQLSRIYRKVGRLGEAQAAIELFKKFKDERARQATESLDRMKRPALSTALPP